MTRPLTAAQRAAAIELLRRNEIRTRILDGLHGKQRECHEVLKRDKRIAVCASRRGGKTHWAANEIALSLNESGKGEWTVFFAPTGVIGKELIWQSLKDLNELYSFGWRMVEHPTPYITTKTGGVFRILGVDDKAQVGKLRGKTCRLVICDESKEYSNFLRELVQEVIEPTFLGVGGRLVITGTPGRVCSDEDYWYAINHGVEHGWPSKHFDMTDNPWIPDAEAELSAIRKRNGWAEDNVIYLREYKGLWVSDQSERVYAYLAGRNSVQGLPEGYDRDKWIHVLAVDFGYSPDPCAWTVFACHPHHKDIYVVHCEKHLEQLSDQAAERTARLVEEYKPSAVVGDNGGGGKSYVEDFNRRQAERLKTWIKPADKNHKRDFQEVMSEEFRAGRIKLCLPQCVELEREYINLGWKDSKRLDEHPGTPNDLADSALYAFREMKAYWHKPPKPAMSEAEIAAVALRERQQRRQRRA